MSEIIWYLSFCDWLISLSITLPGCMHAVQNGNISFFFLFLKYILLIMLLQLSHCLPPSFIPLCPAHPLPPVFPSLPCAWVVHISSLASPFPIRYLAYPVYFLPTIYATYYLYLFPFFPPCHLMTLHVVSISVILFLF